MRRPSTCGIFLAVTNGSGTSCFRADNGGEFTGSAFVELCDSLGIRPKYTTPYKPRQNAVVENEIYRALEGGNTARLKANCLFPAVDLRQLGLAPDH